MRDRLEKFMKTEGLSPSRFAEIMGVQPSSISHILGGRNKPSFDFIEKLLLRFPKVNPDWLLLGKGSMYRIVQGPGSGSTSTPLPINTAPITEAPITEAPQQQNSQGESSLFNFTANSTAREMDKSNLAGSFPEKTDSDELSETTQTVESSAQTTTQTSDTASFNALNEPSPSKAAPASKKSLSSAPTGIPQTIAHGSDADAIERIVIFFKDQTFVSYTPNA